MSLAKIAKGGPMSLAIGTTAAVAEQRINFIEVNDDFRSGRAFPTGSDCARIESEVLATSRRSRSLCPQDDLRSYVPTLSRTNPRGSAVDHPHQRTISSC